MKKRKDSPLRSEVRSLVKDARERIQQAKEDGVTDLNIFKAIGQKTKKIANGKRAGVYMKHVNDMPEHDLKAYKRVLVKFLQSEQTTREGRERITSKARETYLKKHPTFTENDVLKLYDILSTDIYHKLLEKNILSSEQIVELIQEDYGEKEITERNIEEILIELNKDDKKIRKMSDGEKTKYILSLAREKLNKDDDIIQ